MTEKHRDRDFDRKGTTQNQLCLPTEVNSEILPRQLCQGWFHPGNGETDGLSMSYGLHAGCERVLLGNICDGNRSAIIL